MRLIDYLVGLSQSAQELIEKRDVTWFLGVALFVALLTLWGL